MNEFKAAWAKFGEESRKRHATRYTGICPGCNKERTDLFRADDPILCGDCGLRKMVIDHGGLGLIKNKEGKWEEEK